VTQHFANLFENKGIKYLNVPVEDHDKNTISEYFKNVYEFIEAALMGVEIEELSNEFSKLEAKEMSTEDLNDVFKDKTKTFPDKNKMIQVLFKNYYKRYQSPNRILIHCSLGVIRSATAGIMFIMKKLKLKLEETLNFVQFQRFKSRPIDSFMRELENFEKNNYVFIK